jgi:hypothetical protein
MGTGLVLLVTPEETRTWCGKHLCCREKDHEGACEVDETMLDFPCPHGCTHHRVASQEPTACGHYHSPSEWGHHEQKHNSEYWKAIGDGRSS